MNNNIFIAVLFCFSFFLSPSSINLDNIVYSRVEEEICSIEEYGIKIESVTDESIKSTFENVSNYIEKKNFTRILEEEKGIYLSISKDQLNLDINIVEEKLGSRIQIILISKNKIDFDYIKEYFKFINNKDMKYYTYIKGNIKKDNNIDEIEKELIRSVGNNKVKDSNKVNLDNGITGVINLKSDYKFNYSIMTYDEDRKLILGSPIIFTAY